MGEDDNGRAAGEPLHVLLEPLELLRADVDVDCLRAAEVPWRCGPGGRLRQAARREDSSGDGAEQPRTGPGHALEDAATVDAVLAPGRGRVRIRCWRSMPIAAEVVCHL